MPGTVRKKYHNYSPEQKRQIKDAGYTPDSRANGPAIMAYLLAGGERPARSEGNKRWNIHHIYDGKFPFPTSGQSVTVLVLLLDENLFTEAAGLVSVHPIADALADEVPYFAWMLRWEAYKKFGFDPDGVFSAEPQLHTRPSNPPLGRRRPMSQRDKMLEIYKRHKGNNDNAIIREYADAERSGKVKRKRNKYGLSAEDYAKRLLADGRDKGWLK